MNILDQIIQHKRDEVDRNKSLYPIKLLEQSIHYSAPCVSLSEYVNRPDKSGIIAEFKRKSPSKGAINMHSEPEKVSIGYMQAGASAISVLTDSHFFGGSNEDLKTVRSYNYCPILRKDFVIDPYQIHEAKSIGADAILLIASVLDKTEIKEFSTLASELGMEVLLEVHDKSEIEKYAEGIALVGVNNRDLTSFQTDYRHSISLVNNLPTEATLISESGISSPEAIHELKEAGYAGFLIGEYFMNSGDPADRCLKFIRKINAK